MKCLSKLDVTEFNGLLPTFELSLPMKLISFSISPSLAYF